MLLFSLVPQCKITKSTEINRNSNSNNNNNNSHPPEQKYSLEGFGSTTPDVEIYSKNKKTYDNFFTKYNKILNKIKNLLENENTLKIQEIVNIV